MFCCLFKQSGPLVSWNKTPQYCFKMSQQHVRCTMYELRQYENIFFFIAFICRSVEIMWHFSILPLSTIHKTLLHYWKCIMYKCWNPSFDSFVVALNVTHMRIKIYGFMEREKCKKEIIIHYFTSILTLSQQKMDLLKTCPQQTRNI